MYRTMELIHARAYQAALRLREHVGQGTVEYMALILLVRSVNWGPLRGTMLMEVWYQGSQTLQFHRPFPPDQRSYSLQRPLLSYESQDLCEELLAPEECER